MVLMGGVWGAQPLSRYGVSKQDNYHYHVRHCSYKRVKGRSTDVRHCHCYFYHKPDHVTISYCQHARWDLSEVTSAVRSRTPLPHCCMAGLRNFFATA